MGGPDLRAGPGEGRLARQGRYSRRAARRSAPTAGRRYREGQARLGPELRGGQREARRSSSFADLPLPVQRPDQASTAAKSLAWR